MEVAIEMCCHLSHKYHLTVLLDWQCGNSGVGVFLSMPGLPGVFSTISKWKKHKKCVVTPATDTTGLYWLHNWQLQYLMGRSIFMHARAARNIIKPSLISVILEKAEVIATFCHPCHICHRTIFKHARATTVWQLWHVWKYTHPSDTITVS